MARAALYHNFNTQIAAEYGVYEAIVLENLNFWIMKNEANEKHFYDGRYWTYNSAKAFAQLFPYFSEKQIRTILGKLETAGLIVSGNYNKSAYDRTKWYALTEKAYALYQTGTSIFPNGQMENTGRENGKDQTVTPIPDTNTYTNKDSNQIDKEGELPAPSIQPDEPVKKKRGRKAKPFVPPTLEEVRDYIEQQSYGLDPEEFLDRNLETDWTMKNGQKVKDWKARVRTFERNRKKWEKENEAQQKENLFMQHTEEEKKDTWGWD